MIEVELSEKRQYAFTLRKTTNPKTVSPQDYLDILNMWEEMLDTGIIHYVFEESKGLHMHGIIEIPKHVNLIKFRRRGWHVKLEELYNEAGWRYYLLKEQRLKQDLNQDTYVRGTQNTEEDSPLPPRGVSAEDESEPRFWEGRNHKSLMKSLRDKMIGNK